MILALVKYREHILASYAAMTGKHESLLSFDVEFKQGKKYIAVRTRSTNNSLSAHSYIDKAGTIWKAASFVAPAKNFPRGSVHDPSTWTNIAWTGL
jgi:hypothetical protein